VKRVLSDLSVTHSTTQGYDIFLLNILFIKYSIHDDMTHLTPGWNTENK